MAAHLWAAFLLFRGFGIGEPFSLTIPILKEDTAKLFFGPRGGHMKKQRIGKGKFFWSVPVPLSDSDHTHFLIYCLFLSNSSSTIFTAASVL